MFRRLNTFDKQSIDYRRQREAIVLRCLPLADHIARRFDGRGEASEDLVQVARLGLLQAVNRYDVEFGSDFVAFAVPTMMGEVRRYFRDHGWSLKVPRRMKEVAPQINRAREELFQELRHAPTPSEIAGHLGIDREEVVRFQIASNAYSTTSYDTPRRQGDDQEPQLVCDRFGFLDAALDKVEDVETVRPLIAALPERQQTVLILRFFRHMTQSRIAEQLGISQMHVSRLLAQSLASLREGAEASPALTARPATIHRRNSQRQLVDERSA